MRIMPRRKVELSYCEMARASIHVFFSKKAKKNAFVGEFERKFADFIGVQYAMAIPNVRTGLSLFFESDDFVSGDEIILPSLNYHVIPAILKNKGLKPIFVDVDPETWTIDPKDVEEKITNKTKGLIALHLFGQSCQMEELQDICRRRNIFLIEDVAHACGGSFQGKKLGCFGDLAFFSFGTGKALVAFGGGMVATNEEKIFLGIKKRVDSLGLSSGVLSTKSFLGSLAETIFTGRIIFSFFIYPVLWVISLLRPGFADWLTEDKYVLDEGDVEVRSVSISPFQACLALSQLEKLQELNRKRKELTTLLTRLLDRLEEIQVQFTNENYEHMGLYYSMAAQQPDELRKFLFSRGVDTKKGTMRACSALKFFENSQKCPIAEQIAPNIVELPCYPSLSEKDIYYQANLIQKFYRKLPKKMDL